MCLGGYTGRYEYRTLQSVLGDWINDKVVGPAGSAPAISRLSVGRFD